MSEQSTAHPTIVSFLLDCTGSIGAIKSETIGGFNGYLDALEREAGDLVAFTLLQFDSHSIDTLYIGAKLSEVARLTPETYQPRAYTPADRRLRQNHRGHRRDDRQAAGQVAGYCGVSD